MSPDSPIRGEQKDLRVIACNIVEGTKSASAGALAYVLLPNPGGGSDYIVLLIRSRGARWIEKWEAMHRLGNFRFKAIPSCHPLYQRLSNQPWGSGPSDDALTQLRRANLRERDLRSKS